MKNKSPDQQILEILNAYIRITVNGVTEIRVTNYWFKINIVNF